MGEGGEETGEYYDKDVQKDQEEGDNTEVADITAAPDETVIEAEETALDSEGARRTRQAEEADRAAQDGRFAEEMGIDPTALKRAIQEAERKLGQKGAFSENEPQADEDGNAEA